MSDAEMITILVLFHSNTFRNFKHFCLFYVCRKLKEEFPNLLSYTRFVERMPRVADRGIHIVTGIRTNMKNRLMDEYDKIRLRKRSIIETINDMLKNVAQIVHTRHRSVSNFIVNLLAGMAAYAFYDTNLLSIWSLRWRRSRGEAAHTFLKQTCVKQWNFDLKLGRKNSCVL